jgi:hypothetical protein
MLFINERERQERQSQRRWVDRSRGWNDEIVGWGHKPRKVGSL